MRSEIGELLRAEWDRYGEHVRSIARKQLTAPERRELCQMLREGDDPHIAGTITGVMGADQHREYYAVLKETLERDDLRIAKHAANVISGRYSFGPPYPGYLELLFSSKNAQKALGDDFAFVLSGRGAEFTDEMRSQFLEMFCARFGEETPRLDAMTAPWFRMLAELGVANDEVARILVRIWHELRPSDSHNKYLVLRAMAARPYPSYEPILRKANKSRIGDLQELGRDGLDRLGK